MQLKHLFNLSVPVLIIVAPAVSSARAIESLYFDIGEVQRVNVSPGIPTLLEFPCNITDLLKGTLGDIEAAPRENPRHVAVWLTSNRAASASLTAVCDRRVFVINIVPSKKTQAYVKIAGSFGAPGFNSSTVRKISSSDDFSKSAIAKPKVLRVISSSEGTK